jgi:Ankyrin repeats (3 copies)
MLRFAAWLSGRKWRGEALFDAAERGDLAEVQSLWEQWGPALDVGWYTERRGSEGLTPAYVAARNGHVGVVKFLVETCGVDPLLAYRELLVAASIGGRVEVVRYLLGRTVVGGGGDIFPVDMALQNAAAHGQVAVLEVLVEYDGLHDADNLNRAFRDAILSALHYAAAQGQLEAVKFLVDRSAGGAPRGVITPLEAAILENHHDVVQFLEAHQARLDSASGAAAESPAAASPPGMSAGTSGSESS